MDPLCGWCYGNNRTMQTVYDTYRGQVDFQVLPGGLWTGDHTRVQSPGMTSYFLRHDQAIHDRSGMVFGSPYLDLIRQHEIVLDSEVPSRAIVTVQHHWPEHNVRFALGVVALRFREGLDVNREAAYLPLCEQLGIPPDDFLAAFRGAAARSRTQETFRMARGYASGFPTLLLQTGDVTQVLKAVTHPRRRSPGRSMPCCSALRVMANEIPYRSWPGGSVGTPSLGQG
ncbi:DsbA family protein [Neolewinella xylanilytica]|nr:DsbA family protein [Neolewinella xylanilytica]